MEEEEEAEETLTLLWHIWMIVADLVGCWRIEKILLESSGDVDSDDALMCNSAQVSVRVGSKYGRSVGERVIYGFLSVRAGGSLPTCIHPCCNFRGTNSV